MTSPEEHFRKLERMYAAAPCNQHYRPEISIGDREARVSIAVEPRLHHAAGALHGSTYFKVADDSMYFAAQSAVEDVFLLTFNLNLYLLRPIVEGAIAATGRVTFESRSIIHGEATLINADGDELGRATASFARSKTKLADLDAYAD